jgi:pilus assembly protein CpaB
MKAARILVLVVALAAGGAAAFLIGSDEEKKPEAPVVQFDTTDVLIAKSDIGMGTAISSQDLQWQAWPTATTGDSYITKKATPGALEELAGAITRAPFTAGEPIREAKLIRANGAAGYMAAILPSGMRAVSTEISPETGAGGFILPNDRVDVILTKREKNPDGKGADVAQSEIILSNIRVLAIDQAPKEKEGINTLVGRTVTLELKPEQAETLARSRQSGTLALALRSITDVNATAEGQSEEQVKKRSESVNVVRYGVANQTTAQK